MHYSRYIRKQDFFAQKKKKKTRLQVFKSSAIFLFFLFFNIYCYLEKKFNVMPWVIQLGPPGFIGRACG